MKKIIVRFIIFIIIGFPFPVHSAAQNFLFGIKFTGVTIHPKHENNAPLYKWKLDRKGHFVLNGGISITVDIKLQDWFGLKFAQSFVKYDCAGKIAIMSHIGANFGGHGTTFGNSNHGLSGSIGPMLFIRENWRELEGYVHDERLFGPLTKTKWTTKFLPLGGQFEYNYFFSTHHGISVNILPGIPNIIAISPGISLRQ